MSEQQRATVVAVKRFSFAVWVTLDCGHTQQESVERGFRVGQTLPGCRTCQLQDLGQVVADAKGD